MPNPTVFISHATADKGFVRQLQQALADLEQPVWIDARELRGGDPLWTIIQQAIQAAGAFAVIVSPDSLQSQWVADELEYALEVRSRQKEQGMDYRVIPLSLDNTKLGFARKLFGEEPLYIPTSTAPGGVDQALRAIIVALGLKLPAELPSQPQTPALPLEELVLELTEPGFEVWDGKRRPKAKARLYRPAAPGRRAVETISAWEFVAPIGPIEANEIRWYLEEYAVWPGNVFKPRAAQVEAQLAEWGRLLHEAALPAERVDKVLQAWGAIGGAAERRFSVYLREGVAHEAGEEPREAATALLGLPWELLHEDGVFLFQGAKPTRVRRRLANTRPLDILVANPPVRVLLVTARPEDEACRYINHRSSALPLVQAMENLGGLVELSLLEPPTFPGLVKELDRARQLGTPYHVVHFDGHGVYSKPKGLGGLCFEDPQASDKLEGRRHQVIYTDKLGPALRDHRIPLVFLDACQTAQSESAAGSVASELLQAGVASVVAMSHSVLLETARRFVQAFYAKLADGARVGAAMLAGQQALHDDDYRDQVFGAGELRLQDWFVPVLFQEEEDPHLFARLSRSAQEATAQRRAATLKQLPPEPATGFIGRSRELLALERLLFGTQARYAVIQGNGGEGKTALAAEFGRWLVRTRRVARAAFVSVERDGNAASVLNALLGQLAVSAQVTVATADNMEPALLEVQRALEERPTLLVLDNMESLLPLPWLAESRDNIASSDVIPGGILAEETQAELAAILKLCERLNPVGQTRIVFTSREALPQPYAANIRPLFRLAREDATHLVKRVLWAEGVMTDADREAVERLVDAVQCHARTLALLAPSILELGVERTRESLAELMADMERCFPGDRENSLYASVELSLRRLSPENRERARVLGVFHGGLDLEMLYNMMGWSQAETLTFGTALATTGLAIPMDYGHLRLDPALCPYLLARLEPQERAALQSRWDAAMRAFVEFLVKQARQNAEMAATLTGWELPNLMALLERQAQTDDAEATVVLCTHLVRLLRTLGKSRLLERIDRVRDAAASTLGEGCSHARFEAQRIRIGYALDSRRLPEALEGAKTLHKQAIAAGATAYTGADYDIAMACFLLGRVLNDYSFVDAALPLLVEAQNRFEAIAHARDSQTAEIMASMALSVQGDCLQQLGKYDKATAVSKEALRRAEKRQDQRGVAIEKLSLGKLHLSQKHYPEALSAYEEARDNFATLGDPGSVASVWCEIGRAYEETDQFESAERAFREALTISVRLGHAAKRTTAHILIQLGNLYGRMDRLEDAALLYRQAADMNKEIIDSAKESICRSNLATTLRKLGRISEARVECHRAIVLEDEKLYGHATQPWKTWDVLCNIETADGQTQTAAAARQKALELFLAYRRDGGENHHDTARLCTAVAEMLAASQTGESARVLRELRNHPELPAQATPLLNALDAIVAGQRDLALVDNPALSYDQAAEIILLLERLPPSENPMP